jgi:hypothetical protein
MKRIKCMSLGLLKLDASALVHVNNVEPSGVSAVCLFICRTICRRVDQYAAHEADRERKRHSQPLSDAPYTASRARQSSRGVVSLIFQQHHQQYVSSHKTV